MVKSASAAGTLPCRRSLSRGGVWGMQLLDGLGFLGLAALGWRETRRFEHRGPALLGLHVANWHYANVLSLLGTVVVLALAVRENMTAGDAAYQTAKAVRAADPDAAGDR